MDQNWLIPDRLCSLAGDTIRIEIGPQYVELECNDKNLSDKVTHPSYRKGQRDALGNLIQPSPENGWPKQQILAEQAKGRKVINEGDTMTVVDHRARHKPRLWKVYQLQETAEPMMENGAPVLDENDEARFVERFIKVDENEDFDKALAIAEGLAA